MARLQFRPRATFNADLKLSIQLLLMMYEQRLILPDEYDYHPLKRRLAGYREFHVRDTPHGKHPNDINYVLVIWYVERNELIAVGVRVGSHDRLFPNQNSLKKYHK